MSCLNAEELISLLYGETDRERLAAWRTHLETCKTCQHAFWSLKDTHDWIQQNDASEAPVFVVLQSPKQSMNRFFSAAAVVVLAIALAFGYQHMTQLNSQSTQLLARQTKLEQSLQDATVRARETNKNQYMMLLALKDYLDKNYQTRKVSYETFQ